MQRESAVAASDRTRHTFVSSGQRRQSQVWLIGRDCDGDRRLRQIQLRHAVPPFARLRQLPVATGGEYIHLYSPVGRSISLHNIKKQ